MSKLDDLMKQIETFEATIAKLQNNVALFKQKIQDNVKKYGPDPDKWPSKD